MTDKPYLFREHRGGFLESMATAQPVAGLADVGEILGYDANQLVCEYYCHDDRNGWDTHLIRSVTGVAMGFANAALV